MTEQVEKRMEEMIPEFEELERIGLLSSEELRVLVMKRRHFMYKINAMNLSKKDILAYMEYETLLLELFNVRREKFRMFEKVDKIEYPTFRRLIKLLTMATRRFPHDLQLWEKRITFAKSIGFPEVVWHAYKEMSEKHPRVLSVWVDWAQYEITAFGNFEKAREILVSQAVLHHPGNKALFREIFRFELMYCEYLFRGRFTGDPENEGSVPTLSDSMKMFFNCEGARVVYQDAVVEHPDVDTAIEFYHVASIFPFAALLRHEIFQDICERFGDQAEVRLLKAEREALGLSVDPTIDPQTFLDALEDDGEENEDVTATQRDSDGDDVTHDESGEKISPPEILLSKNYLGPYRIYVKTQKEKKRSNKSLRSSVGDREAAMNRLLESPYLSTPPQSSNNAVAAKKSLVLRIADTEDRRLTSLLLTELLALMHHSWSCNPTLQLLASKFVQICRKNQDSLSPQQLLIWATVALKFSGASEGVLKILERVCEGPSPSAAVMAIEKMTKLGVAADDEYLIRVFNKVELQLPEAWRHAALRHLLGCLKPSPAHTAFLEQHSSVSCLDKTLVASARVASLWAACQKNGLPGARAVYKKYEIFPPFCSELYSTMCFLELGGDSSKPLLQTVGQEPRFQDIDVSETQFSIDTKGDGVSEVDDADTGSEQASEDEVAGEGEREENDEDVEEGDEEEEVEEGDDEEEVEEGDDEEEVEEGNDEEEVEEGSEEEVEDDNNGDEQEEEDQHETKSSSQKSESNGREHQDSSSDSESSDDEIVLNKKTKKTGSKNQEFSVSEEHTIDIERIRNIFKSATRLVGGRHHAVWLAYRQFEVKFGDTKSVSLVNTNAEHLLDAWCLHAFKNSILDILHERFVDESEVAEQLAPSPHKAADITEPAKPAYLEQLPPKFFPSLRYRQSAKRDAFFGAVSAIESLSDDKPDSPTPLGRTWYDVLTLLLDGKRILPRMQPEKDASVSTVSTDGKLNTVCEVAPFKGAKKVLKKNAVSSTALTLQAGEHCPEAVRRHNKFAATTRRDPRHDMTAMLASSSTLKPEFLKKTELEPAISKTAAKKKAKAERKKTAGKGWDYMKAPEITPEVANDIELLKMRGILDPKQKFKSTHMKVTPKYFQMATVKDDPIHFYNRLTKKQRKATLAEEIINDQEIVSYQKRKYAQLVAKKEAHRSKKRKTGEEFIELSKNVK